MTSMFKQFRHAWSNNIPKWHSPKFVIVAFEHFRACNWPCSAFLARLTLEANTVTASRAVYVGELNIGSALATLKPSEHVLL